VLAKVKMVKFTCDQVGCVTGTCMVLNGSAQQQVCHECASGMVHQRFFLKLPDCGEPQVLSTVFIGLMGVLTIAVLCHYLYLFQTRRFTGKVRSTAYLGLVLVFTMLGYVIGVFLDVCSLMIIALASSTILVLLMLHFARDALLMPALGMRSAREKQRAKAANFVSTVLAVLGNTTALIVAWSGCLSQDVSLMNNGMWSYGMVTIASCAGMAFSVVFVHRLVEKGLIELNRSHSSQSEDNMQVAIRRLRRIRSLVCIFGVSLILPLPWLMLYPSVGSLPFLWIQPFAMATLIQSGSPFLVGFMAPPKSKQQSTVVKSSSQVISARNEQRMA
jgi:hypothetical protein